MLNRGYSAKIDEWKESEGKAYFVAGPDQGYLKVSFFGRFYGSYVVFALDREHYRHVLASGPDRSYPWILSRTPDMKPEIRDRLVAKAAALGFDTDKLTYVEHR